jgi:hypothetical protein
MNIAQSRSINNPRLAGLHGQASLMMGVDRTGVRSLRRFSVGSELKVAYLVREFLPLRVEVDLNPPDMVFGCIGVSYLLPQGYLHWEKFIGFHLIRTLYYRNMLLRLPVCALKKFSEWFHFISPFKFVFGLLLYHEATICLVTLTDSNLHLSHLLIASDHLLNSSFIFKGGEVAYIRLFRL